MKKIGSLTLSRLRTAGHLNFHKTALKSFDMGTPLTENDTYRALVSQYDDAIQLESDIVRRQQALLLTPEVIAADDLRDATFRQLIMLVDAAGYSSDPAEKTAAQKISIVIKPYRKDYKDVMAEETEDIRGLLVALSESGMSDYCTTLKLEAVIERLGQQNDEFDLLYQQRAQQRTQARGSDISTKEQRKVVDDIYRRLVEMVNSVVTTAALGINTGFDQALLSTLTQQMNALIEQYKLVIANQNKSTGSEEEEDI